MTGRSVLTLASLAAALSACQPTREERAIVNRWLLCEECSQGELEAVVPLGDRVTGTLAKALLKGPSNSKRTHIRRQAQERFDRLPAPVAISGATYVDHYESNYVATYQAHAAVALGRINTPQARAALVQALQRDSIYRYDVLRELAYAAPIALDTAAGGNQAAPRDSVVRVDPAVFIRDSVTGQGLASILVRFTVDSGGGTVSDSLLRTAANGVASVQWTLGSGPDSFNVLRAEAYRRNILFHATGHGLAPRAVFVTQPTTITLGQPVSPAMQALVLDAWGQRDTTFSGPALLLIAGSGTSVPGTVTAGKVDFPALVPPVVGTARLVVEAPGATSALSQPFNVVP